MRTDLTSWKKCIAHQTHNKGGNHGIKSPLRVAVITNQCVSQSHDLVTGGGHTANHLQPLRVRICGSANVVSACPFSGCLAVLCRAHREVVRALFQCKETSNVELPQPHSRTRWTLSCKPHHRQNNFDRCLTTLPQMCMSAKVFAHDCMQYLCVPSGRLPWTIHEDQHNRDVHNASIGANQHLLGLCKCSDGGLHDVIRINAFLQRDIHSSHSFDQVRKISVKDDPLL